MSVPASNLLFIWNVFTARLGNPYVYGGVWSPTDTSQGCDCSGLVGTVLEALTKGPDGMNWVHDVSTESWRYDYDNDAPAAPGSVGPYGTIAIGGPHELPADAALLICIMHGGGGEDSHMNCVTDGRIMESNGDNGTCTNTTGGTSEYSHIWTDFWYLPGPVNGRPPWAPPDPRPYPRTYLIESGDTLTGIAERFGVTSAELLEANPGITDADLIYEGQTITIP